jgi:hypothetical protein
VAYLDGHVVSHRKSLRQLCVGGHRYRAWRGLPVDDLRGLVPKLDPNAVGQLRRELPGTKVTLQRLLCSVRTGVVGSGPRLQGPVIKTTVEVPQIAFPCGSPREVMALFQRAKLVAESFNAWVLHGSGVFPPRAMSPWYQPSSRRGQPRLLRIRAPKAHTTGHSTRPIGPHRGHIRTANSGQPRTSAVYDRARRPRP